MTLQEIFDKSVKGMLDQGRASLLDGSCRYRMELDDGTVIKCAVGHLLTDKAYGEHLEDQIVGMSAVRTAVAQSLGEPLLCESTLDLLNELQDVHDTCADSEDFITDVISGARYVAEKNGLNTKVLDDYD